MKVLLAPLFFRSRVCKHCARIFYKENPGSWLGLKEFATLPPLGSFRVDKGFVPDFPTLLMFDEFVVDGEALELLKNPGDRYWLNEWSELIEALESEGALVSADVNAAARRRSQKRGWMMRRDMADPNRWWHAMAYYNALNGSAEKLIGDNPKQAQDLTWQFDSQEGFYVRGDDGEWHDLAAVLADGRNSDMSAHRDIYPWALAELKSNLQEMNACITACDELGVAPIMWAPYRRYLEEKIDPKLHSNCAPVETAGRKFFEVAFPAYSPTTVRQFAKLRSDKRIQVLRNEIIGASKSGDTLDPKYPQRVLTEVLKLEQNANRMRRISGWITASVGVIPVPGLGIAATAIAEGVLGHRERKLRDPWHWFYLISDGRGGT